MWWLERFIEIISSPLYVAMDAMYYNHHEVVRALDGQ